MLRRHQRYLSTDDYLRTVYPKQPLLAIKQPPNLKQQLVRSKLKPQAGEQNCVEPCHKRSCETCEIICTDTTFNRYDKTHKTRGEFTCSSTNVVYLIRCAKGCEQGWYVGETSQTLRGRMNGHRRDIREDKRTAVSDHFNLAGHSVTDIRVSVLQGQLRDTRERRIAEMKIADHLETFTPKGLNRDHEFMSHYN